MGISRLDCSVTFNRQLSICNRQSSLRGREPALTGRSRTGGNRLLVDQFLEFLAGLEVRHFLRRNIHLVAGLRVAPLARLALAESEAAEPPQLNLLAALQRIDDAGEDRVNDQFGVLLREVRNAGDLF